MNDCLIIGSFLAASTIILLIVCAKEMRSPPTQTPADDSPDDRYWREAIAPASAIEVQWMQAGYNHCTSDLITMLERVASDPTEGLEVKATLAAIAAELRGKSD